jgi:hypothetical protein
VLLAEGGVQLGQRAQVLGAADLHAGDPHRRGDGVGDDVLVRQAHVGDHLAQPAAPLVVLRLGRPELELVDDLGLEEDVSNPAARGHGL